MIGFVFDALQQYSCAIGVCGVIVVCRLSICHGCILATELVLAGNFLHK